jgi:spectinomycin phosphotransferase
VRTPPAGLDERALADALSRDWTLRTDALTYVPKGAGSYHWIADVDGSRRFVTVDDLDRKPWLGADRETVFAGLRGAFEIARTLQEDAGLAFVLGPMRADDGRVLVRLTERYSVAVFPFVDGEAGDFAGERSTDELDRVIDVLVAVHGATPVVPNAGRRGLELAGRADLETALAELDTTWTGGPWAEATRARLRANQRTITDWLATFDDLTTVVTHRDNPLVLTHGEPHHGNFLHAGADTYLIDWDTVGLAPPERDLWMLADGAPHAFDRYQTSTGRDVDPDAVELYRLTWTLADIAAYSSQLRAPHEDTADTEKAWAALTHYLP